MLETGLDYCYECIIISSIASFPVCHVRQVGELGVSLIKMRWIIEKCETAGTTDETPIGSHLGREWRHGTSWTGGLRWRWWWWWCTEFNSQESRVSRYLGMYVYVLWFYPKWRKILNRMTNQEGHLFVVAVEVEDQMKLKPTREEISWYSALRGPTAIPRLGRFTATFASPQRKYFE